MGNDVKRDDPLSAEVLGAAFAVANTLGHGFLEAVYRRAMVRELSLKGILVEEEVGFSVTYKGQQVGRYRADLVVDGRIIVELKCVERLVSPHVAQTFNYLRASGLSVALLVNFGRPRIEWKRLYLGEGF
ncbi:GxxExxY protein [Indioceanicola profundi]|uniref:GxxExxY protein n=1 Tax=Indioceanicola profundi TaxID=2220096 RepID=UPI000E6AC30B|nr:GxxExxY protein [Indioceanicola profundi]